jgi:hypothetical protein
MDRRHLLVSVSTAQLLTGVAGQLLAVKRRLAFDVTVIGWKGQPDRVLRDSWLIGTGVSAPVVMLACQAAATAQLSRRPSARAARTLGVLGAVMVGGYLVERETRKALSPRSWDRLATPVIGAAVGLAALMGGLGLGGHADL